MARPISSTKSFAQAKTLVVALGILVYLVAVPIQHPQDYIFLGIALVDLVLVIPYYFATRHGLRGVIIATHLSITISALSITAALFATEHLIGPGVLIYFFLFPLGVLAVPRSQTVLSTAGINTLAYLILLIAQWSAWIKPLDTTKYSLTIYLMLPPLIIASFWFAALVFHRLLDQAQSERHQRWLELDQAQRRAEQESIWHTVGKAITAKQDLDEVLNDVLELIDKKVGVETGAIFLTDDATNELYFGKMLRHHQPYLVTRRVKSDEGIAGWVIAHRQSQLVNDTKLAARWSAIADQANGFVTRSVLTVPMIAQDQVIGIIELLNEQPNAFNETHLRLLELIAAPVAISIQNARLHHQIRLQLGDVTDLLKKVTRAKNEWEQTVDAMGAGIVLLDTNHRIVRTNRTLAGWLHAEPNSLVGQCLPHLIFDCTESGEACETCQANPFNDARNETELDSARLGKTIHLSTYAWRDSDETIIGSVNVLQDVTTQKALQAQLVQSEKLAGIGRMAASLAHEINNPLQAIQGCLDLAQVNPTDALKQERYLTMAKGEVDRLATMVQRILDFYRPAKGTREPTDVRQLLDEVLALSAKRLQHSKMTVRTEWANDLPLVNAAANQLKQVFLNLLLNAADAMPDGGEMVINVRLDESEPQWVLLDFTDTGHGIPAQDLDKIFEPIYTTKTRGTGLGLGVSHNIITSHGGRLTVTSAPGKGSTFTIWLPT